MSVSCILLKEVLFLKQLFKDTRGLGKSGCFKMFKQTHPHLELLLRELENSADGLFRTQTN